MGLKKFYEETGEYIFVVFEEYEKDGDIKNNGDPLGFLLRLRDYLL
jgi:hypothetical protein